MACGAMNDYYMGTTAENIAEKFKITKKDQDEFATLSQNKAENAQKMDILRMRYFQ